MPLLSCLLSFFPSFFLSVCTFPGGNGMKVAFGGRRRRRRREWKSGRRRRRSDLRGKQQAGSSSSNKGSKMRQSGRKFARGRGSFAGGWHDGVFALSVSHSLTQSLSLSTL